jgi:UDP-N-acetyl-D-glucosamine dehydrogenase
LAGEVNSAMPEWVIGKISEALNQLRLPIAGSRVLVLGIAYKKNVDDMRESPSVEIMELLRDRGAEIAYSDDFVPKFPVMREHSFDLESTELSAQTIQSYDCVVLATDHDTFDYELIQKNARVIVDTRGHYPAGLENVVKA